MFGEYDSESPRLPSPWRTASLSRASLDSPSPLSLRTPTSTPGTPTDTPPAPPQLALAATQQRQPARARAPSFDFGFDGDFEALALDDDDDGSDSDHPSPVRQLGGLDPEVDSSGHIEYKLKLPSPTPIRLAKLQTQLKWRLVEGGGMALYELGVLDNGTLVGLPADEMHETLATLGKMLRGLGGGEVRVGRVVRIGTGAGDDDSDEFASFDVDGEEPDLDYDPGEPLALLGGVVASTTPPRPRTTTPPPPATTQPIAIPPRHPYPERTPAERAQLKRTKRDARRTRRESDGQLHARATTYDPASPRPAHHTHRPRVPGASPPLPTKAPAQASKKKMSQSAPAGAICRKPRMAEEGETRFVVEAVVVKKGPREDSEEGWRYLDFDWMREEKGILLAR